MPFDPIGFVDTETPVLSEVGQVLWDAADYIEKHGWLQGAWGIVLNGPRCVLGALSACDGNCRWHSVKQPLADHLGLADTGDAIINWNNAPGRTKEEVVTALRNAARVA